MYGRGFPILLASLVARPSVYYTYVYGSLLALSSTSWPPPCPSGTPASSRCASGRSAAARATPSSVASSTKSSNSSRCDGAHAHPADDPPPGFACPGRIAFRSVLSRRGCPPPPRHTHTPPAIPSFRLSAPLCAIPASGPHRQGAQGHERGAVHRPGDLVRRRPRVPRRHLRRGLRRQGLFLGRAGQVRPRKGPGGDAARGVGADAARPGLRDEQWGLLRQARPQDRRHLRSALLPGLVEEQAAARRGRRGPHSLLALPPPPGQEPRAHLRAQRKCVCLRRFPWPCSRRPPPGIAACACVCGPGRRVLGRNNSQC